jgi:hypothetical protein
MNEVIEQEMWERSYAGINSASGITFIGRAGSDVMAFQIINAHNLSGRRLFAAGFAAGKAACGHKTQPSTTPCIFCGPDCQGGAAHNARVEDGVEQVQAAWEYCRVYGNQRVFWVSFGARDRPRHNSGNKATKEEAWQAVLDFTNERKRKIAEREEDMRWLFTVRDTTAKGTMRNSIQHVIEREQAALAELRWGMR